MSKQKEDLSQKCPKLNAKNERDQEEFSYDASLLKCIDCLKTDVAGLLTVIEWLSTPLGAVHIFRQPGELTIADREGRSREP